MPYAKHQEYKFSFCWDKSLGVSSFSITVMCLSIGTPKNNKFSICSKIIILEYIIMENFLFSGVPKFGHITA